MIKFRCRGPIVLVLVEAGAPLKLVFEFEFDARTEWAARLLADTLEAQMLNQIQAIRKAEYEEGWRDAKAKKDAKKRHFWWSWVLPE